MQSNSLQSVQEFNQFLSSKKILENIFPEKEYSLDENVEEEKKDFCEKIKVFNSKDSKLLKNKGKLNKVQKKEIIDSFRLE